jgi:flagellar hook assembly protein FlgD
MNNFPNPFNPITTLRYDLPENSFVNVTIYDMLGREVKRLVNGEQASGYYQIVWDGTDNYGEKVSAGVYLYRIQASDFVQTKKMVLLK